MFFFYNLQYIRRIFKVSYIIECIRDYYRAEISGSYCGNYDCKILKYLFVFFFCVISSYDYWLDRSFLMPDGYNAFV